LSARELIVRIVTAPRIISRDPEALGYSDVDVQARRGTLATVFADRVHTLATERYFDEGTLLGRAIAHEIGHLLLGVVAHPKTGLMRGYWVTDIRLGDWTFSSAEGTGMREGLASRADAGVLAMVRPDTTGDVAAKKRGSPKASP